MSFYVDDSGKGAPVVLLHSSGMSGRQWRRLASELVAAGSRAVVPDLLGHGRSTPRPEPTPFSFADDVAQVTALLEAIASPVHLVGHSYGGFIAMQAALAAPARVRSMALYDPVAFGSLDAADDDARRDLAGVPFPWESTAEGRERWLQAFVGYWGGGSGAWAALREDARAEFRRVAWVVYRGAASLTRDATPARAYQVITAPILIMTGEGTPLAARRVVDRLGRALPNAQTETVPSAGHMGPLTHADVVGARILAWLASV